MYFIQEGTNTANRGSLSKDFKSGLLVVLEIWFCEAARNSYINMSNTTEFVRSITSLIGCNESDYYCLDNVTAIPGNDVHALNRTGYSPKSTLRTNRHLRNTR